MSGFYDNTDDDKTVKKTIVGAVLAASLTFLAFLLLLYHNTKPAETPMENKPAEETVSEEEDLEIGKSNKRSQDLDFWDMFRSDPAEEKDVERDDAEGKPAVFTEQGPQPDKIGEGVPEETDTKWDTGDPNDGKHIAVTDPDGKTTWYEILDIPRSTYSATFVKKTEQGPLTYDGPNLKSASGAMLCSDQSAADLSAMKEAGLSFVMLRSIVRDGTNGAVVPDAAFSALAQKAKDAGLFAGVYVDSAATTTDEAVEEANYAIASAKTIEASYPVAISVPDRTSGDNRMHKLNNEERTGIVKAFCDQVRSFGMKPLIRATKADLITRLNVEDLSAYDIWVCDSGPAENGNPYYTDYPYVFTMWGYGKAENITGFDPSTQMMLSFVNYEQH